MTSLRTLIGRLLRVHGPEVALALGWSVCLTILATWPLAPRAWEIWPSPSSMPDLNTSVWSAWGVAQAVRYNGDAWVSPVLHWPLGQDNQLLLWNLGCQVLQLPLFLGLEAAPALNISILVFGTFNGLAAWGLGRGVGGSRPGAAAAAALVATQPFVQAELALGRMEQGLVAFLALAVLGLVKVLRTGRWGWVGFTAASWAAAGYCYWFYGYFLLLVLTAAGLWQLVRRRWDLVRRLVVLGALAALLVAPLALPLLLSAASETSIYQQQARMAAEGTLMPMGSGVSLSDLVWPLRAPPSPHQVFPLYVSALLLAGLGPLRRRCGGLALLGLGGLVFSLGSYLALAEGTPLRIGGYTLALPFAALQEVLPGFWRLYWPYRFLSLAVLGAAGCAAVAVGVLQRRRWLAVLLVALVGLVELRVAASRVPGPWIWTDPEPLAVPDLFRELAREPDQHPLLVLPFAGPNASLRWIPYHQQPLSEGNGDMEDRLHPAAWHEWVAAHPVMAELKRMGRANAAHATHAGARPGVLAELGDLGFAWAVIIGHGNGPLRGIYQSFLGRPPDVVEDGVLAWRLRPTAPVPGGPPPPDRR